MPLKCETMFLAGLRLKRVFNDGLNRIHVLKQSILSDCCHTKYTVCYYTCLSFIYLLNTTQCKLNLYCKTLKYLVRTILKDNGAIYNRILVMTIETPVYP